MINYFSCRDVDIKNVFDAFKVGFSDYMMKLEIDIDTFIKRFFGSEGNQLENSFIALDGDEPIGLILGGIKDYEGLKTIRCGALCIHPDYRGKGVSKELFKLHKETAINKGCKQMFLEVIVGNDRAIKFYKNLGYDKIYDLSYFSCSDIRFHEKISLDLDIKKIDYHGIAKLRDSIVDIHINWQNDFDYMEKLDGLNYYGIYEDLDLIGALCINQNGKIHFVYIESKYRKRGIGKMLISYAVRDMKLSKLFISFPNNANLEGFLKHLGFTRDEISQYEMYLTL